MAGYCPRSVFCEFMDLQSGSVHKHAKKELGQYPAILTSLLVKNPVVICLLHSFFLEVMNAAVVITVTGHQKVNKPSLYILPWAFARKWNGEVHRRDELLTQAKQIER